MRITAKLTDNNQVSVTFHTRNTPVNIVFDNIRELSRVTDTLNAEVRTLKNAMDKRDRRR